MAMYPSQDGGSGNGAAGGGPDYCVVNGDSSQQSSGNTTPLAFDYMTRSLIKLLPRDTVLLPCVRLSVCPSVIGLYQNGKAYHMQTKSYNSPRDPIKFSDDKSCAEIPMASSSMGAQNVR